MNHTRHLLLALLLLTLAACASAQPAPADYPTSPGAAPPEERPAPPEEPSGGEAAPEPQKPLELEDAEEAMSDELEPSPDRSGAKHEQREEDARKSRTAPRHDDPSPAPPPQDGAAAPSTPTRGWGAAAEGDNTSASSTAKRPMHMPAADSRDTCLQDCMERHKQRAADPAQIAAECEVECPER